MNDTKKSVNNKVLEEFFSLYILLNIQSKMVESRENSKERRKSSEAVD